MKIDLTDWEGDKHYAQYKRFKVQNEQVRIIGMNKCSFFKHLVIIRLHETSSSILSKWGIVSDSVLWAS